MDKKLIKQIIPVFENHPEVKLVYVFGSQATGNTGPLSDYDFAVYLDEKNSKKRFDIRLKLAGEISSKLKTDAVDVVVLNDIEQPELKFNIIKDSVLILEKEPFKVLIEPKILMEYFDFHDLLLKYNLTKG